jgi:putative oxidoreductase
MVCGDVNPDPFHPRHRSWLMFKMLSPGPINRNLGLLVIRLGAGVTMLVLHGYGKLVGGPDYWTKVGAGMGNLGVTFVPAFWGFMAMFSEFICSILLVLGVLFRPALILLGFTMFVAIVHHLNLPPDSGMAGWNGASQAVVYFCIYVGLYLTGPGKYAFSLMKKRDEF